MDENSLKRLWYDSNKEQKVEINPEVLIESIHHKSLYMENKIKQRDKSETIVAVLMTLVFGCLFFVFPQALSKIGAGIIVINCMLIIFRLYLARKVKVKQEISSEIKHHLMVSLQQVRQQINLLNTMIWWYLLPIFIGVLCVYYGLSKSFISRTFYTVIVTTMYGYIWYLNKEAVRKKLKPLEADILQALKELSE